MRKTATRKAVGYSMHAAHRLEERTGLPGDMIRTVADMMQTGTYKVITHIGRRKVVIVELDGKPVYALCDSKSHDVVTILTKRMAMRYKQITEIRRIRRVNENTHT